MHKLFGGIISTMLLPERHFDRDGLYSSAGVSQKPSSEEEKTSPVFFLGVPHVVYKPHGAPLKRDLGKFLVADGVG